MNVIDVMCVLFSSRYSLPITFEAFLLLDDCSQWKEWKDCFIRCQWEELHSHDPFVHGLKPFQLIRQSLSGSLNSLFSLTHFRPVSQDPL